MNAFYEWLYDNYAAARLSDSSFPLCYQAQKQEWQAVTQKLPSRERLLAADLMNSTKLFWGAEAFACGVRVGLLLAAEVPTEEGLISPAAR